MVIDVVYLINRLPSPILDNNNLYEILFKNKLDLSNLKTFRCVCYVQIEENKLKKLDPRSRKCICLGYKAGTNTTKIIVFSGGYIWRFWGF